MIKGRGLEVHGDGKMGVKSKVHGDGGMGIRDPDMRFTLKTTSSKHWWIGKG